MKSAVILLLLASFLYSCSGSKKKSPMPPGDQPAAVEETATSPMAKTTGPAKTLRIEGNNIWVRAEPSTGEIVMKLNNGDECEVLEKGPKQEIQGIEDYWYKISFQGKVKLVSSKRIKTMKENKEESQVEATGTFAWDNSGKIFKKI